MSNSHSFLTYHDLYAIVVRACIQHFASENSRSIRCPSLVHYPHQALPTFTLRDAADAMLATGHSYFLLEASAHAPAVHTIAPAFRAEDPPRPNHLHEFTYVQAFIHGDYEAAASSAERLLQRIIVAALASDSPLQPANKDRLANINFPISRIRYDDAVSAAGVSAPTELSPSHEHDLANQHTGAVRLEGLPLAGPGRRFGYKRDDEHSPLSFDLLLAGTGAAATGGERALGHDEVHETLKNVPDAAARDYLTVLNTIPTTSLSDYSLSIERVIQSLQLAGNIQDGMPLGQTLSTLRKAINFSDT